MPTTILTPGSNESPDSTQGGLGVTSPTNNGHAATTSSVAGASTQNKTCRWSGFSAPPPGQVLTLTLQVTWTETGSLTAGGANLNRTQYSTNNGGSWSSLFSHANVTSAAGPTVASVALSTSQDTTQVQVRDLIQAAGSDPGDSASVTGTIASVQIEAVTSSGAVGVMM